MSSAETTRLSVFARVIVVFRSAVLWVAAGVGAICVLVFLAAIVWGIRPQAVVSGSMAPSMPTGSLVFVRTVPASELQVGEVVTVPRMDGHGIVTHRITAIQEKGETHRALTLKGDANAVEDPEPYDVEEVGLTVFSVPGLGFAVQGLQTPLGIGGVIVVGIALVACFVVDPGRWAGRGTGPGGAETRRLSSPHSTANTASSGAPTARHAAR